MAQQHRHLVVSPTVGSATAGTADEQYVPVTLDGNRKLRLVKARFVPQANVTANNTNYATMAVKSGATVLASFTTEITGSGNLTEGTDILVTVASDAALEDSDVIEFDKVVSGSGVGIQGHWMLLFEETI